MYDLSYFNTDEYLWLEQEFVSCHQSAEKLWTRSMEGAMQELPERFWEDCDATCS